MKKTSQVEPQKRICILRLNDGEFKDSTLYRLQTTWTVRFIPGPSLPSPNVDIYCNLSSSRDFAPKGEFHLLPLKYSEESKREVYAECEVSSAGTFQYFFEVNSKKRGSGYFVVDPVLNIGPDNRVLPLDSICMHTVLSKSLGLFSDWESRLLVSCETGYNMIHFTPLQELGISNSSYSIADQLKLNPKFSGNKEVTWNEIGKLIEKMKTEWNVLSASDVVWNHTAKNSEWLRKNPECGFNLKNCPYLRPAYILDRALYYLSIDIGNGVYAAKGISKVISSEKDLTAIEEILLKEVIPSLKLWEFFQVDIEKTVQEFETKINQMNSIASKAEALETISILQDMQFIRCNSTVNMATAVNQFYLSMEKPCLEEAKKNLESTLTWLNAMKKIDLQEDIFTAVKNVISTIRYERLDDSGPKKVEVSQNSLLVTEYFYHPYEATSTKEDDSNLSNPEWAQFIMAHNGWVMGDDSLKNFAEYPTKTYLRRELVSWGDSVKLNYGKSPEHCPALWQRMREYTELTAKVFHGIRIDNCHSTPIHVAEYMLNVARKVNPNLYVFAELFTGSEEIDNIFVNKLGINSLIREGLVAWNSHELGRLVYKYGGKPVASFVQPSCRPLVPSVAHALLYDVTHDNESDIKKRTPLNPLPFSSLVTMACCAVGSSRGHDELVPHHIHVVNENRLYRSWKKSSADNRPAAVEPKSGIIKERMVLNHLHQTMAISGYDQVFVDQRNKDVVAVTRHNPTTHHSYILVAHTAFSNSDSEKLDPMLIEGRIERIAFEAKPENDKNQYKIAADCFEPDQSSINGLSNVETYSECDVPLNLSRCCTIEQKDSDTAKQTVVFTDFPPGSVVVFCVKPVEAAEKSAAIVRARISDVICDNDADFARICSSVNLHDMNRVLFRCNPEEQSDGVGIATYEFPGWGSLNYCGLQGIASVMAKIRVNNDVGHPVCQNLRDGDWLMQYVASRLQKFPPTRELGDWFSAAFEPVTNLPRYLVPVYFDMILSATYPKLLESCWSQMSSFVSCGNSFVKMLALGSVALHSVVRNSGLPQVEEQYSEVASLAAGLPHFSTGIMRCWGRDTFIALRGLMLITGRYNDAKQLVLGFASCVRHGLIPNLLGEGKICRYNCRDAVWWWLQCIQDICEMCEDGYSLLKSSVSRIYPTDDSGPDLPPQSRQSLCDVMQECLQCHINGIGFEERGAGESLDNNMTREGFFVEAGVDLETGFVFGGSKHNCGTWMDKMGESTKAGTKGIPATPRDGSAVELVALCKSTVSWLHRANNAGQYPYDGVFVKTRKLNKLTWGEWAQKIQTNFEEKFFISEKEDSSLVHKRYIYKDCYGASHPWSDYQLRPNFPIAMVVAPELFNVNNAWRALIVTEEKLLGPLGIKTLDIDDMMYRGDYDNTNDSDDRTIAKGFNYHQGPEWVWPVGFFLRAKLYFANQLGSEFLSQTVDSVRFYLHNHQEHLENSDWKGLPELTNSNGAWCRDSCEIQAWSNATILEVLFDMQKYVP